MIGNYVVTPGYMGGLGASSDVTGAISQGAAALGFDIGGQKAKERKAKEKKAAAKKKAAKAKAAEEAARKAAEQEVHLAPGPGPGRMPQTPAPAFIDGPGPYILGGVAALALVVVMMRKKKK